MPKPPHATAIVIAAYNEEQRLSAVLRDVKREGWPWIVVVDDGSRDKTAAVAKAAGADIVLQRQNKGQGAALRAGIQHALKRGAERVVTYDADGQFLAREIKSIVAPVARGEVDIVFGSRFIGRTFNMTWRKRVMLKCAILFTRVLSGLRVTDTHNGFRCFSRKAAQTIHITQNRMEHASEIIDEVARLHLSWKEVPVTIIYHEEGQHPFRAIGMGLRLVQWKLRRIARRKR